MTNQTEVVGESIANRAVVPSAPARDRAGKSKRSLWAVGVFIAFAVFFFRFFRFAVVEGPSMLPTFHTGQRLLVSKAYWLFGPLRDGDIVVLRDIGKSGYIIKRIYKMGGEKVNFVDGPETWQFTNGEFTVPAGEVYVLGDNRAQSEDSRAFGPLKLSRVLGKVIL